MENDKNPPNIRDFKTAIPGWQQVGDKYRGVIGCSMTESATDPSYHEFVADSLHDTPDEAMRSANDLHHKLSAEGEQD